MKKVIVIFGLVCISLFGFSACEGESAYDEIEMDLPTSTMDDIDDDDESGNGPG